MLQKKSSEQASKISLAEEPTMVRRKSSQIVEDYKTDHYNIDYPSIDIKRKI